MQAYLRGLLTVFSVVLCGCGARTSFFDPADFPDGYLLTDAADADLATGCVAPLALCDGLCIDPRTSAANCGGCTLRCAAGQSCIAGRCTTATPLAYPEFRVDSYGTSACRAVEHSSVTGDDRGGIAMSSAGLLYTGDTATGRFDPESLGARALPVQLQAMLGDLSTGRVYSLALGTALVTSPTRADTLVQIDPNTGASIGAVRLSTAIELGGGAARAVGFFSGYGRVAVETANRVYDINPSTGVLTALGAFGVGAHTTCETWGFWGVAETLRGELWLDYVENPTTIVRRNARTGETQTVARFSNLSDMCSFTASPARGRWYFHHEGLSQFRSGDETVGYCDAAFSVFTATRYTLSAAPADVRWIDACSQFSVLRRVDDNAVQLPLPFGFHYWGELIAAGSPVNITSNGWIGLNIPMNASLGGAIPSEDLPNNVIAPYWGDNFTRDAGVCVATVGAAPNRSYVVEWSDTHHCCADDPSVHLSYEVILRETAETIDFIYNDMRGARQQTIGLENSSGTEAAVVCNAGAMCSVISTGTRIRFTPTR